MPPLHHVCPQPYWVTMTSQYSLTVHFTVFPSCSIYFMARKGKNSKTQRRQTGQYNRDRGSFVLWSETNYFERGGGLCYPYPLIIRAGFYSWKLLIRSGLNIFICLRDPMWHWAWDQMYLVSRSHAVASHTEEFHSAANISYFSATRTGFHSVIWLGHYNIHYTWINMREWCSLNGVDGFLLFVLLLPLQPLRIRPVSIQINPWNYRRWKELGGPLGSGISP